MSIPKILFRTVSLIPDPFHEKLWEKSCALVDDSWATITYRDGTPEMAPWNFPRTSPRWVETTSGAHKADLIRLEAMHRHGGIYLDADAELTQTPPGWLLDNDMFAAWEDSEHIPNAIFGAKAQHPLVEHMLTECLYGPDGLLPVWETGPGVFTRTLQDKEDVTVYDADVLYPYHYSEKRVFDPRTSRGQANLEARLRTIGDRCVAVHHWNHSWKGTN